MFQPDTLDAEKDVATTHFQILRAIKELYPEAIIYDNDGRVVKKFQLASTAEYLRHYKLIHRKGNERKNRGIL